MADWAGYGEIVARCMGLADNQFIKAYENNAKLQVEEVMETSLVAACINRLVETDEEFNKLGTDGRLAGFHGTATQLKTKLEEIAPTLGIDTRDKEWPKKPNMLTKGINIIKHTLKQGNIEIDFTKIDNVRFITIKKFEPESGLNEP